MKRKKNLLIKIISDENLSLAIDEVNRTHRWCQNHKPNRTTLWVETTKTERIKELRQFIIDGFIPAPPRRKRIYDRAAGKWRDICEPKLYPDQYVHHALIQVLTPILMANMDKWCCGSICGRGIHYGAKAIKKWMKNDTHGTRYCAELDIHHFYNSIQPSYVMDRMRQLIKDGKVLTLIEILIQDGILIGYYFSQWFANTLLQPIDKAVRESRMCAHYVRYMDNFTIFGNRKRRLRSIVKMLAEMLKAIGLKLKDNWQVFRVTARRLPNALGYRYGRGFTLIRKANLLRIKRKLAALYRILDAKKHIQFKASQGILSRLGQLKHCNSKALRARIVRQNFIRMCKNIIRKHSKLEVLKWTTALENYRTAKSFAVNAG